METVFTLNMRDSVFRAYFEPMLCEVVPRIGGMAGDMR